MMSLSRDNAKQLPPFLVEVKQWIAWRKEPKPTPEDPNHFTKPPVHPFRVNDSKTWVTFDEAMKVVESGKAVGIGFVPTPADPVIMIDIDHCTSLAKLPRSLAAWVSFKKPYMEYSPSGKGLRIIAYIDQREKAEIKKAYAGARPDQGFEGQVSFSNNYQTITMDVVQTENDPEDSIVDSRRLNEWFNINTAEIKPFPTEAQHRDPLYAPHLPSMEDIIEAMMEYVTLQQTDRIKRVYEELEHETYSHYQYWSRIGMALYDYGSVSNQVPKCEDLFVKWSQLTEADPTKIAAEEDLRAKFRTFGSDDTRRLTFKTLLKYKGKLQYEWPYPVVTKATKSRDAQVLPIPDTMEYDNYDYLLNDYANMEIRMSRLGDGYLYLNCDSDIYNTFFKQHVPDDHDIHNFHGPISMAALEGATWDFCRANKFRKYPATRNADWFKHYFLMNTRPEKALNPFKIYIETDPENLPETMRAGIKSKNCTLDYIFNNLEFHPRISKELHQYYRLFETCIMQMMKHHFYEGPYVDNNIMPVFQGPEKSYKSTFWKFMIPPCFRQFAQTAAHGITTGADRRDSHRALAKSIMYIMDEFESTINDSSVDQFKKWFSDDNPSWTDKYDKHDSAFKRISFVVGTTNSDNLILGDDGTRRFAIFPIVKIRTEMFNDFNWHAFYRIMYKKYLMRLKEFKAGEIHNLPWVLTDDMQVFTDAANKEVTAKTALDELLYEIFDIDACKWDFQGISSVQVDKTGHLRTASELKTLINMYLPQSKQVQTPALKRSWARVMAGPSNTLKPRSVSSPECVFDRGIVKQGQYTRYYCPPVKVPSQLAASAPKTEATKGELE